MVGADNMIMVGAGAIYLDGTPIDSQDDTTSCDDNNDGKKIECASSQASQFSELNDSHELMGSSNDGQTTQASDASGHSSQGNSESTKTEEGNSNAEGKQIYF
ncbi:uncharacterized protein L201_000579 [Kwoniella dendrophila CBS 6074]|uniref:Pectate lyase n=1 Tax=Kwoniella dendrophila CBS 6074 TaxID=1295534 RepID=A0AAX4JLD0_9TREE